jgi:nicotinamide-nucleotide amidase
MVRLRLSSYGKDGEELKKNIEQEILTLRPLLEKYIFAYEEYNGESPSLEKVLSELLRDHKKTVALAESCTGGYVASLIAALPGASQVFKGAIVPYSNQGKNELLDVENIIFETVGAVSRECVEALAANVIRRMHSDYSIAISGIAGPTGGTAQKPVGTVWIAVASARNIRSQKFQFGDNRQRNIVSSASAALNMLRKFILEELGPVNVL